MYTALHCREDKSFLRLQSSVQKKARTDKLFQINVTLYIQSSANLGRDIIQKCGGVPKSNIMENEKVFNDFHNYYNFISFTLQEQLNTKD